MGRYDEDDGRINCRCEDPMFVDESALGMGVNCFRCGKSAEHRLPSVEAPRETKEAAVARIRAIIRQNVQAAATRVAREAA